MSAHTPGPWRFEINRQFKSLHLVGGKPQYDLTILEPVRWGMGKATFMLRDLDPDGMNLLHKLHERQDWIAPFPGRAHHASWCSGLRHTDIQLIEAAPDLLAALKDCLADSEEVLGRMEQEHGPNFRVERQQAQRKIVEAARAAIAKAEGG